MLTKTVNKYFFSVLIPTRNRPEIMLNALNSVLEQQHDSFEIIIINDGSENQYMHDYFKAIAPYKESNICFTNKKNTNTVYAIYMPDENEGKMPASISIESFIPEKNSKITLLGSNKSLKWKTKGKGITIEIPKKIQNQPPCNYAWSLKIEN